MADLANVGSSSHPKVFDTSPYCPFIPYTLHVQSRMISCRHALAISNPDPAVNNASKIAVSLVPEKKKNPAKHDNYNGIVLFVFCIVYQFIPLVANFPNR